LANKKYIIIKYIQYSLKNFIVMSKGKKSDPEELDALLRGLLSKESPSYNGLDFDGGQMQKKAPSGFMGMRGKKDQGWAETFTGSPVRGMNLSL